MELVAEARRRDHHFLFIVDGRLDDRRQFPEGVRTGDVHRPAFQHQRPRRGARQRRAIALVEPPRDDVELRPRKARHPAIGDGDPAGDAQRLAALRPVDDIVRRPVEAFGQIDELQGDRARPRALDQDRQRRFRRQIPGHAAVEHPLGQPRAAQGLISRGGLQYHAAVRPRLDDRLLLAHLARLAVGAAQGDAALQKGVDQPRWRQQPRVAILLAHPVGHPRHHRRLGQQPFGNPLETQHRRARGQRHDARLGDQRETLRPVRVDRPRPAIGRAIDGDRDVLQRRRHHHRGIGWPRALLRRERRRGQYGQYGRDQVRPAHDPGLSSANRRWR